MSAESTERLRVRVALALKLEPMSCTELATVFCLSRTPVAEALQIMEARGEVKQLSDGYAWVNVPKHSQGGTAGPTFFSPTNGCGRGGASGGFHAFAW